MHSTQSWYCFISMQLQLSFLFHSIGGSEILTIFTFHTIHQFSSEAYSRRWVVPRNQQARLRFRPQLGAKPKSTKQTEPYINFGRFELWSINKYQFSFSFFGHFIFISVKSIFSILFNLNFFLYLSQHSLICELFLYWLYVFFKLRYLVTNQITIKRFFRVSEQMLSHLSWDFPACCIFLQPMSHWMLKIKVVQK